MAKTTRSQRKAKAPTSKKAHRVERDRRKTSTAARREQLANGAMSKVAQFVKGDPDKLKPKTEGYFSRPLAPAPLPVLTGVAAFTGVLLVAVAINIRHEAFASISCFLVLLSGAAVLDYSGRKTAEVCPNPIYKANSLPTDSSKMKPFVVFATLAALIGYVSATAKPGEWGSPLPYFFASDFLFLVMPQLLSRRAVRGAEKLVINEQKLGANEKLANEKLPNSNRLSPDSNKITFRR